MRRGAPGATRTVRLALIVAALASGACSRDAPPGPAPASGSTPAATAGTFFEDVTDASGIDFIHANGGTGLRYLPETMVAGGCALDYDGDGWIDVYLVQSADLPGAGYRGQRLTNRLFRNRGNGTFEDVTDQSGTGDAGYGAGAVSADYDNDGDADLYVLNFGPNVLLRNDGGGKFTDVSAAAGVDDDRWGSSGVFFDADGDGDLDLYVVNYVIFSVATNVTCGNPAQGRIAYCHPDVYPASPDVFYRNRGDGTFEDATVASGLVETTGKGLGAVASDFDNDGDLDLYVANDSTPNFLFENHGDGTFEEAALFFGVGYNEEGLTEAGMGVDAGDINGDEYMDLFVTNFSRETNALYLGGPDGFVYDTRRSGLHALSYPYLGFGTDIEDFDNDGDRDIFVTNGHVIDNIEEADDSEMWKQPSQLFLNDGRGDFSEVARERVRDLAVPRVGRGEITLDYDNDGRMDVLVSFNNDRARLFRNVLEPAGNWIGLRLQGVSGNRDGVGARVEVTAAGRRVIEETRAGSSYQTSADPRLHFGLGPDAAATRITIRWPGGSTQELSALPGGRYYRLVEGGPPTP